MDIPGCGGSPALLGLFAYMYVEGAAPGVVGMTGTGD